jgi:DNA polymerase-4
VVIPEAKAREILAALPIGRLWGVGKVSQKEMARYGIRTVRDFLAIPEDLAVHQFGDHARHLRQLAVGYDTRPVIPSHEAKSIGNEVTFGEDIAAAEHLHGVLDHLSDKVARRVRAQGFVAKTITLKARYSDFSTFTRSESLTKSTDSSVEIRKVARHLLVDKLGRRGRALRLIGVTASNLSSAGQTQGELFADPGKSRNRKLDQLMDEVHHKYGDMISRGLKPPSNREE